MKIISKNCNAIHITENVLGQQRVSPLKIGEVIKDIISEQFPITVSMRVRDKNEREILKFVNKSIDIGFSGILIIMGDPPQDTTRNSGEIPSIVIKRLKDQGLDSKINLYLSISNKPNSSMIEKKIQSNPSGFMTQVVQNVEQVTNLVAKLKGFKVIPIILFPSKKNERSAKFLKLDLVDYNKEFEQFVKNVHGITKDVLITSPNDFNSLYKFLENVNLFN